MPQSIDLGILLSKDILIALATSFGLITLDVLLGILLAFSKGEFDPRKLPQFLQKSILPYVGSVGLMGIFSFFMPQIKVLFFPSVAAVDAKFLFDVKDKIFDLIGVKLPENMKSDKNTKS